MRLCRGSIDIHNSPFEAKNGDAYYNFNPAADTVADAGHHAIAEMLFFVKKVARADQRG